MRTSVPLNLGNSILGIQLRLDPSPDCELSLLPAPLVATVDTGVSGICTCGCCCVDGN
uniref:Uncharacterized protein n=1 Tax=Arundo donax TaxID=35708 RepID=A0A0A8YWD0_ARUDO